MKQQEDKLSDKNFGLSETQFNNLLKQLQNGNRKLTEVIYRAHFKPCMIFLKNKYAISHTAAYDSTMEALIAFERRLLQQKITYGNMRYLFTLMASQIYLKMANKKLEAWPSHLEPVEQAPAMANEDLEVLQKALQRLGQRCRELLQRFYFDRISLRRLTKLLNYPSEAATRQRKSRCVKELKKVFYELC